MRFILCQPSIPRFKWELEVCLTRLFKLGIEDIVLLFAKRYDSIPLYFKRMGVEVHVYDDADCDKFYIPAIRPYLWMRYLREVRTRERAAYFYIDSDVLLRELPDVAPTPKTWIASNCKNYLGVDYIVSKGETLLVEMCKVMGIDPKLIREKQPIGGAQWAIHSPSTEYWEKVYRDSVNLYRFFVKVEPEYVKRNPSGSVPIQKWTAEMWAQLWNAYHFGIEVETPDEMNFSWPNHNRDSYYNTKIFHNAGVKKGSKDLFFKGKYVNASPFDDDLSFVSKEKASYEYVLAIREVMDMPKYEVIVPFRDKTDKTEYFVGDRFPKPPSKRVSKKRLEELLTSENSLRRPVIKQIE